MFLRGECSQVDGSLWHGDHIQVHAGLAPDLPLKDQDPWAMYNMRNLAPASDDVAAAAVPEGKTRAVSKRQAR